MPDTQVTRVRWGFSLHCVKPSIHWRRPFQLRSPERLGEKLEAVAGRRGERHPAHPNYLSCPPVRGKQVAVQLPALGGVGPDHSRPAAAGPDRGAGTWEPLPGPGVPHTSTRGSNCPRREAQLGCHKLGLARAPEVLSRRSWRPTQGRRRRPAPGRLGDCAASATGLACFRGGGPAPPSSPQFSPGPWHLAVSVQTK